MNVCSCIVESESKFMSKVLRGVILIFMELRTVALIKVNLF